MVHAIQMCWRFQLLVPISVLGVALGWGGRLEPRLSLGKQ